MTTGRMTTTLPNGVFKTGKLIVGNAYVTRAIRNYGDSLQLGNVHASNTLLAITSNTNGIHLSEATSSIVWVDSPLTTTKLLSANAGIVTNSLTTDAASITGGLTAQFLVSQTSVTTNTLSALSSTVAGTSFFGGASSFQSTLNVIGSTVLQSSLSAQSTSLLNLSVATFANLNSVTANTITTNFLLSNTVTANVGNLNVVQIGASKLSYDTSNVGFENLHVQVNNSTALRLYNSDQRALFPGGVVSSSISSKGNEQLVLKSNDPTSTVIVQGNLFVQGSTTNISSTDLRIDAKTVVVARSNTAGADADVIASNAGLVVETGTSGLERSLLWNYNQAGIGYVPTAPGEKASDRNSFWEIVGGNLQLTRVIPSGAHIGYNFTTGVYAGDNLQTKVSYRFAIQDDESFQIEKVNGGNLSAGGAPIGSVAVPVATFEVPAP